MALLEKHYDGTTKSLAGIATLEKMPRGAVMSVLRTALDSFHPIIKQSIIRTYKLVDADPLEHELKQIRESRSLLLEGSQ